MTHISIKFPFIEKRFDARELLSIGGTKGIRFRSNLKPKTLIYEEKRQKELRNFTINHNFQLSLKSPPSRESRNPSEKIEHFIYYPRVSLTTARKKDIVNHRQHPEIIIFWKEIKIQVGSFLTICIANLCRKKLIWKQRGDKKRWCRFRHWLVGKIIQMIVNVDWIENRPERHERLKANYKAI